MFNHTQIWVAIDALAARYGYSVSGLAKQAGLDPTIFNKSKRIQPDGRLRWPSTESISRILAATGASIEEFTALIDSAYIQSPPQDRRPVPLIGFAQAGSGGFFDDGGFPAGTGWDEVSFPNIQDDNAYALEVSGESMLPLYRDGDIIVVSPSAQIRRGDRVVLRTLEGEVMAKVLGRQTTKSIELISLNPDHEDRTIALRDVDWLARILWASQ